MKGHCIPPSSCHVSALYESYLQFYLMVNTAREVGSQFLPSLCALEYRFLPEVR